MGNRQLPGMGILLASVALLALLAYGCPPQGTATDGPEPGAEPAVLDTPFESAGSEDGGSGEHTPEPGPDRGEGPADRGTTDGGTADGSPPDNNLVLKVSSFLGNSTIIGDSSRAEKAVRDYVELLRRRIGLTRPSVVAFFKNAAALRDHLKKNEVHLTITRRQFLVEDAKANGLVPFLVAIQNGATYGTRVVVVPRSSKASTLSDLQDAKAAIQTEAGELLDGKALKDRFKVQEMSGLDALLAVATGTHDVAVVEGVVYRLSSLVNSLVAPKLKLLFQSKRIYKPAIAYRKGTVGELLAARIGNVMPGLTDTPEAIRALTMFAVEGWLKVDEEEYFKQEDLNQ